jgi:transposase
METARTPDGLIDADRLDGPGQGPSFSLPVCSATTPEQGPCPVCPHLAERFEPFRRAAYWQAMHQKAKLRIAELEQLNAELHATLRLREQQLFARKSEASATRAAAPTPADTTAKKPRGQQPGQPGPPRRDHSHLPPVEEVVALPEQQQLCSCCGLPFVSFPGAEDSEILEVEVKAYRRVIHRRRYRPTCSCGEHPGIITAPPPPRVIPKSILGVSIWVEVLLDKFLFYRPTYRLLVDWQTLGLDLSLGTLTDGLQRLLPLFAPLYEDVIEHNQKQTHWHADETRWLVFATVEGKVGYRWWLWVFHSAEAVVFVLSKGRAHDVPEDHFGPVHEGILSVDRYSAYKATKQVKEGLILLAFCWAHVRRDFLEAARSWPSEEEWALGWVERIGRLYEANDARLLALEHEPEKFAVLDGQLRQQVEHMACQAAGELADTSLHPARKSVLTSLEEHWDGLTVFVDFPEVPLDNNTAERAERGPVVLRKNSYGSAAVWAGELAAMLFSVFQTLCLWNINPRVWLTEYLQTCARAGGRAPTEEERGGFLPWRMSAEKRQEWSLDKDSKGEDSS